MACYKPIRARYENGKVKFSKADSGNIDIPCGRCIGCRLDYSRQWAVRCVHEAQQNKENAYVTLTYDDKYLPDHGSLDHRDFQNFMKKLRKRIAPRRVRYYMCGEYGEQCAICERSRLKCECESFRPALGRPHYHALLFGYDFPDKYVWKKIKGNLCYRSPLLEDDWEKGISTIGGVTFESAAYVARYILKKQKKESTVHYSKIDGESGEILGERRPEYTRMSLRAEEKGKPGGIGAKWLEKHLSDVYPDDFCVVAGKKYRTPRYYDNLLKTIDKQEYERVKSERRARALLNSDNSRERLVVREKVTEARVGLLERGYENA